MSWRSRSRARGGFWPTGWKGARKMPNFSCSAASRVVIGAGSPLSGGGSGGVGGGSRRDQDLAVLAGAAQGLEGAGRTGQVHRRGDQAVGARHAVAQALEGGGELDAVVAEGEAELDLLG